MPVEVVSPAYDRTQQMVEGELPEEGLAMPGDGAEHLLLKLPVCARTAAPERRLLWRRFSTQQAEAHAAEVLRTRDPHVAAVGASVEQDGAAPLALEPNGHTELRAAGERCPRLLPGRTGGRPAPTPIARSTAAIRVAASSDYG